MMVLGFLLHEETPLLNDSFAGYLNTFVFQIALPTQLFKNLSESDFYTVWDGGVVVFCFAFSLLFFLLLFGLSQMLLVRSQRS